MLVQQAMLLRISLKPLLISAAMKVRLSLAVLKPQQDVIHAISLLQQSFYQRI